MALFFFSSIVICRQAQRDRGHSSHPPIHLGHLTFCSNNHDYHQLGRTLLACAWLGQHPDPLLAPAPSQIPSIPFACLFHSLAAEKSLRVYV